MSSHQFIEQVARIHSQGLLTPNAPPSAMHIAHEGNPTHPQLEECAKQNGYENAYDGLVFNI